MQSCIKKESKIELALASIPLAAEPIFEIGNFTITNSMLNAYIAVAFFCLVAIVVTMRKSIIPKGIYNFIEMLIEFAISEIDKVTNDKIKTKKFLPLVATIFFFVLFSNWLGQLPGTGSIGIYELLHGELELVPLLRPATSDLNLTLGIAMIAIFTTHLAGMRQLGIFNHISKFLNFKGIFKSLKKGPMAIIVAIVEFFIGLIEIIGEFAKTLSLSLRLFGNIFAGEVLMTVMLGLFSYVLPIPFMFLEILVGIIQATVFAMLTLAFLVVATMGHGEEEHEEEHATAHA
ncbi:F0F1 ATP synthase subunit A [Patescibacteria group bacterium]|nr:F0F1 ATP synthase subunit A [Patescibacteria group bacterium]MCG2687777.1 F0F1 ATP synthase subunit A [Candidatus Parcubacteria bacterium]